MSTKKPRREEQARMEAEINKGADLVLISYLIVALLLIAGLVIASKSAMFLAKNAQNSKDISAEIEDYTPWPDEIREQFQKLLIQNGGRVKPAKTFSRFTLIQMNNSSTAKFEDQTGETHKLDSDEWLLDVLFRGDLAKNMPIFNVDDTDAVIALGVKPKAANNGEHRKRDRYSYNQLLVGREKLAMEGQRLTQKFEEDPDYELTRLEGITQRLGRNVSFYEYLLGQFGYARKGEGLVNGQMLPEHMKKMAEQFEVTDLMDRMPEMSMQQLFQMIRQQPQTNEDQMVQAAFQLYFFFANSGRNFNLLPPSVRTVDEWHGVGEGLLEGMSDKSKREWVKERLNSIADIHNAQKKMWTDLAALPKSADEDARNAAIQPAVDAFKSYVDYQYEETAARKEAKLAVIDKEIEEATEPLEIERLKDKRRMVKEEGATAVKEVKLYTGGYFKKSLAYFIFGFVILALSWLAPKSKAGRVLTWIATALLIYGLVLNIYGITMRSIIRSRPPITNLYDTVIFITGIAVLLALALEFFTKKGIGLLMAALIGVGGMFLSLRYEVKEATDTMDPLQAVLDTNFWLATHVTTINIGYAAGMLSAFLGCYYLLKRFLAPLPEVLKSFTGGSPINSSELFDAPKEKRDLYKTVTNMNYGIVCFCLFFSLVGTVLGGVWANYSWGRFWGWDPKENGALMICLWTLVILHMRMGGYVRDIGIAVLSILLGVIVTFSWWGVNNLGVGLHSYGFTEGVWPALYVSWAECAFIMACGIPLWWYERVKKRAKKLKRAAEKEAAAEAALDSGAAPEGA